MARVAVVTSSPPNVEGGHLVIARALVRAIEESGHESGLITTVSNPFGQQSSEYLANFLTDVSQIGGKPVDHVISLRYPSYAVRHTSHVCWLNHTMREYYDLWEEFSSRLSPQGRIKERVRRELIRTADSYFFKQHLKALFAQSRTVQERLQRWNHVASTILYPPAPQREYRCDGYGDFIFVVSRLEPLKRIDLILQALATSAAQGVRCVIAGGGDADAALRAEATRLGLNDRVTFAGRVSDEQLLDYLARCRAVCFVPQREDYGFVTVEAFSAGKAVVTVTDSGGPAELVVDGVNGRVTSPDASALGLALAEVASDAAFAERLGREASASARKLNWPDTCTNPPGGSRPVTLHAMATFRLMTYNILYGGVGREERIREVVEEVRPDVVVFNEVTSADSFDKIAELVGPHRAAGARRAKSGHPVIVSRWPILESHLHGPSWEPDRFVEVLLQPFGGPTLSVSGVHLTPQSLWPFEISRWREVRSLLAYLRRREETPHVIAGDFNTLMAGDARRREGMEPWVRVQLAVQGGWPRWALRPLTRAGYSDGYRACHQRDPGFTVPAWDPGIRLDYVFASPHLKQSIAGAGVCASPAARGSLPVSPHRPLSELFGGKPVRPLGGAASDHLPVWVDFEWEQP